MLVLAVALIEGMIKEFSISTFCKHPERMYDYLNSEQKGAVSFKIIIDSKSKKDLIEKLAKSSSSVLLQGKFVNNLKNIEKICNCSIPKKLKKQLIEIVQKRNQIVHEAYIDTLSEEDVSNTFNSINDFLLWLGEAAVSQNVPIHDPASFIAKSEVK